MAEREINLKFTSDTSAAKKGAQDVKKSVDAVGKSKGIKEVNKDLDQTKQKAKAAAAEVNRVPKGQGKVKKLKPSPEQEEFTAGYKSIRSEVRGLSEEYENLAKHVAAVIESYRSELAALDETSEGYQKSKTELERLITQGATLQKQIASSKAQIDKFSVAIKDTSRTLRKFGLHKAQSELDKMGAALGAQQKKFELLDTKAGTFADAWSTKQAAANAKVTESAKSAANKRAAAEKKANAQLKATKLSYADLVQQLTVYQAKVKNAKTTAEFQKANAQLKLLKARLREVNREATLTGSKAIASAKSFDKMALAFTRGTVTGRASISSMLGSLSMFVKTNLALTAVTTIWTLFEDQISGFLDKWQELDPATEANKKKMEEMAEAVREAGRAAIEAGHALAEQFHSEETARQADIAIRKFEHEKEALENNVTALEKLSKARQADMELAATIAGDEAALKKLQIENDYINGKISATEKAIALKRIEADAATAADQLKLEQAREELQLRRQLNEEAGKAQAAANRKVVDVRAKGANLMSEKEIAVYEKTRASIEAELMELAESDRTASTAQRVTNDERRQYLWRELDRINARRDESGRNTAAEYEAWQRELEAAEQAAEALTSRYNELNSQMYEQQAAVSALEKSNARRAEARKNLAAAEEKNLRDEEKQNKRDEANKKRVDALKDKVDHMELSELKARQARIQRQIANETNVKKRGRLENYAAVYSAEMEERTQRGNEARQQILDASQGAMGKALKNRETAANLAASAARTGKVNIDRAVDVLERAIKTKDQEDDAAAIELYTVIQRLLTAAQKNSADGRKLKNRFETLKRKAVNLDA